MPCKKEDSGSAGALGDIPPELGARMASLSNRGRRVIPSPPLSANCGSGSENQNRMRLSVPRQTPASRNGRSAKTGPEARKLCAMRLEVPSKLGRMHMRKWRASQVRLLCPRLHSLADGRTTKQHLSLPRDMNLAGQRRHRFIRRGPQMPREVRPGGKRCRCKVAARTAAPAVLLATLRAQAFFGLA